MTSDETVVLRLVVYGQPQPGGSKRASRHGAIRDANPKAKGWREHVASSAAAAMRVAQLDLLDAPLAATFDFYQLRPKGHHKPSGELAAAGRRKPYPTSAPDTLKLARLVEDGMTGIVYRDDALIVREHLAKHYGSPVRVEIAIALIASP